MTTEQINSAILITNEEYAKLYSPTFEGQTKVDANKNYKMYWSAGGQIYYTINSLNPQEPKQPMKVVITFFAKAKNGDQLYEDNKPVIGKKEIELPIKLGYGSYNEPKKVFGAFINVEDLISIEER